MCCSELSECLSRFCGNQEWISAWNSDQQPRFIRNKKVFQQLLINGLQSVPSTNFEFGQIHHNLRINFCIHHEVLHEFSIHHAVLNQFFIHQDLRINFLVRHDLLITFPIFPFEGVETCQILHQFKKFTSLEISGIFSSIPTQHFSDVTTLSSIHLAQCIQRRILFVVINIT